MKKYLFVLFMVYAQASINAQQYNPYNHPLSPTILNRIDRLLTGNNLYKANMTAQDYNVAGMYFYEKRLWQEAEIMFSRAIYIDSYHALANYNLACVYSIQLYESNNQNAIRTLANNEILIEDITPARIFGFLYSSVISDNNRMIRARADSDFNNLRRYDSELFDAITLPEDQRRRYKYDVTYIIFQQLEGHIDLIFAEIGHEYDNENNRRHWHRFDGRDEKIRDLNLDFWYFNDGFAENEELLGKRFKVEYIYEPRGSEFVGGLSLFRRIKLISIMELQ